MDAIWRSLPKEIVEEVMTKLPVKSLSRFKCVSKDWRDLICSSDFKTLHYHNSVNKPFSYLTTGIRMLNSNAVELPLHLQKEFGYGGRRVVGSSSSGLVCVRLWSLSWLDFVILNPATKEFRLLPKTGISLADKTSLESCNCAGFDVRPRGGGACDYKVGVVCFYNIYNPRQLFAYEVRVYLYSKCRNSWKKIEKVVPNMLIRIFKSVTLNGSIYWLAQEILTNPRRQYVACFDMWREKFTQILTAPLPYCNDGYMRSKRLITVNEGSSLAMFCYTGDCSD